MALASDGSIKVTKQAENLRCETSGELRLRQCYLRRALAFDQIGLASFAVQERWHNRLFQALMDAPPNGYRYCSVQQVLAADMKLWHVVSQESRGHLSIRPTFGLFHHGSCGQPSRDSMHNPFAQGRRGCACVAHIPKGPKGKGKDGKGGKGHKGKGKPHADPSSAPTTSLKELLDSMPANCVRAADEGRFLCPFYNKGFCRFQKRKSCRFGKHACYFKGCHAERPYIECKH